MIGIVQRSPGLLNLFEEGEKRGGRIDDGCREVP
jgi:hypothetical protein